MGRRTARLGRYLQRWWESQLQGEQYPCDWRRGRAAEQIAAELRRDLRFELSQSTFLHRRPDEATARAAMEALVPRPDERDAALLVAAVVRAGGGARRVRATTGAGAVLTVFALVVRNILRGR